MKKEDILNLSTLELYDKFLEFFDIRELISPGAYEKYKHYGQYFFLSRISKRLLETMLWIRINVDARITINNWLWGGRFDERGIRDTSTPMVQNRAIQNDAWLSGHVFGKAFDYDVEGQTAEEHRQWLQDREELLPHPIRLERKLKGKQINWVHIDVCEDPKNPKVYQFDI